MSRRKKTPAAPMAAPEPTPEPEFDPATASVFTAPEEPHVLIVSDYYGSVAVPIGGVKVKHLDLPDVVDDTNLAEAEAIVQQVDNLREMIRSAPTNAFNEGLDEDLGFLADSLVWEIEDYKEWARREAEIAAEVLTTDVREVSHA